MTMPQMTGDVLAAEVRALRDDLPIIIICSGYSERMSAEKAASVGIKGLLMKPVEMSALYQAVSKALSGD